MSEQPHTAYQPSITECMSAVMEDVGAVGKDSRNQQQGFNFRGVDAVVNAASPALRRHGVVVAPKLLTVERSTSPTAKGGTVNNVYVTVRYRFHGPAGDHIDATVAAESFDSGDKATAKAMSVAYRTALLQALCLPTDEPTDPDAHTYERGPARPAPEAHRPTAAESRRRPAQPAVTPEGGTPLPAPVADQYRDRILQAAVDYAPGDDRDGILRGIAAELRAQSGGLSTQVEIPEPWRPPGAGAAGPLSALITLARTSPNPNDPWEK